MEPEGILNACTTKVRMKRARRMAMAAASNNSRNVLFFLSFRDCFDLLKATSAFRGSLDVLFFFNFCPFLFLLNAVSLVLLRYGSSLRIIFRLNLIRLDPFCKGLFPFHHGLGESTQKMALFLHQKHMNYRQCSALK